MSGSRWSRGGVGVGGYSSAFVLIYANAPGTTAHIYITETATARPPKQITCCSATRGAPLAFRRVRLSLFLLPH